jgi:uncharacterized membrane protein
MNEGLIWTFEGRVIICLILAFLEKFMAVFVGLPLLSLLVATGVEFTHWAAGHIAVIAFAVFVVAMLVAAGLGIRANHRATRPAPEPQPILPAPEPVVGWSMPAPERQWDQR